MADRDNRLSPLIRYIVEISILLPVFVGLCFIFRPHGKGLSGDYIKDHIAILIILYYALAIVLYWIKSVLGWNGRVDSNEH